MKSMKYDDRFKYLVSGYYGIKTMDEYQSKLYILKDIENYIRKYVAVSESGLSYQKIAEEIYEKTTLKEKLQDSLIVLNDIKGPIELVILIKRRIKELKYNEEHKH